MGREGRKTCQVLTQTQSFINTWMVGSASLMGSLVLMSPPLLVFMNEGSACLERRCIIVNEASALFPTLQGHEYVLL